MQKWFEVIPELVKAGDNVRIYDSKLECYTLLEVLKVCPKTLRVLKFDEKKEIEYPVYIQHKKLGLIPREIGKDEETPKIFEEIAQEWFNLASNTEESGYFTVRAGFYFIYSKKLWFLRAPFDREGKYMPHIEKIAKRLRDEGATSVIFDEGELD
jgi:hypothetical protein